MKNNRSAVVFLESGIVGRHIDRSYTSHSWRKHTTQGLILSAFYDPFDEKAHQFAKEWIEKNDQETAPNGIYSDFDQRYEIFI